MIVRRKASIEGLVKRLSRKRISAPASPLAGGPEGPAGNNGRPAGLRYKFDTATAAADPGAGALRLNNAALATATALYISESDADGNSLAAMLATWDDSTSTVRGQVVLRSVATGSDIAVYNVTGSLTDEGTWDKLTIAHVASGGAFANGEEITISFLRTGDKGEKGEAGANGTNGEKGATGEAGPAGQPQIACRAATTAALAAYTRTTNKIVANANGALAAQDGVTLAVNDVLLLKNGAAGADNGPYKILATGSGAAKFEMERVAAMDTSAECVPGMLLTVAEGTQEDTVWQLTTNGPITLNTTALTFSPITPIRGRVNKAGEKVAGRGFICEKTATGKYTVTLTAEWPTEGILIPGVAEGETLRYLAVATSGKKAFTVQCRNQGTTYEDTTFNFLILPS